MPKKSAAPRRSELIAATRAGAEPPSYEHLLAIDHLALVGRLLPSLIHDALNPLAAVMGFAEALLAALAAEEDTARQVADAEVIYSEARRCRDVLRNRAELCRPIAPMSELEAVSLPQLARQAVTTLTTYATAHRQTRIDLQDGVAGSGDDLRVAGVPGRLRYVVLEVLHNAIEATQSPGAIEIRIGTRGARACLEVEDTAPALSAAERERAFELYFTTRPRGTGLGLPLARWICAEHGGGLELAAGGRGGNLVTILLPRWSGQTHATAT